LHAPEQFGNKSLDPEGPLCGGPFALMDVNRRQNRGFCSEIDPGRQVSRVTN
jgi:hypothetical protein